MKRMVRGLVLVLALVPAIASADPASQLFDEGRALLQQGKPAAACAKFEASLKLDPEAAGVVLNLGLCNVQQHKVATALKWFRRAQTFPDVATVAQQQITTLSSLVPTIRVDAPANATVTIDGDAISDRSKIEIDAGHHVAELEGVAHPFDVDDDPSHTQVITVMPPAAELVVDRGASRRHAAKIIGVIGGGLWVATAVVGFVGRSQFDGAHDLSTRQHWKSIVEYGGTSMFALGAVALGTAAALYVTAPGPEHTTIAPVAAPGQVGVSLTGVF